MAKILVTGGAGYIGSHTVVELLQENNEVIIVDNFINSNSKVLERIKQITKKDFVFYEADISDVRAMDKIFSTHKIDSVIHFAALKAVGESVVKPIGYYENNVGGSLILFKIMSKHNVKKLVFSSSATVYGDPHTSPITEDFPLFATNPYGWTKLMIEQILRDIYNSDNSWSIALLRYFNPVGAHESGLIGEDPNGVPNNLMPYIAQVAVGKREFLNIFGDDYPTHDGTGVRDYIHVVDLAIGHLKALTYLDEHNELLTVNLGTGIGYSVLDVVNAFSKASEKDIAYKVSERRSGDVACYFANPELAFKKLGWKTQRDLLQMCKDSWNWQSKNPFGYLSEV